MLTTIYNIIVIQQLVTVIPWVQVGACVDQLVTSVHVNPTTPVPSVISVPQDIMVFQTAEVSTDILLDI